MNNTNQFDIKPDFDFFASDWEAVQAAQEAQNRKKAEALMIEIVRLVGAGEAITLADEVAYKEYATGEMLTARDEMTNPQYF